MNVLVTGANGLLGHHVVMELLKNKHSVQIIVRSRNHIFFDLQHVSVFEGDFTDDKTLVQAAAGCEAIIHIAAVTATNLLTLDDYRKINVEGVSQVIKASEELDIRTIVYISSANTIGYGTKQYPADEHAVIQYPFSKSFYAQSKAESEQLMLEASKKPDQHIIIINPTFMLGPYDTKPGSGKLLLMGYKRKLMLLPGGGKNFVDVHNVAVVVCNSLTQGRNGERYLASGINLSFKEYYTIQKEVGHYNQKIFVLPDFVWLILGKAGDMLRMLGIKTDLGSINLRQLLLQEYYSNQKAKNELNLPDTELKVTIKEAINWFIHQKMA